MDVFFQVHLYLSLVCAVVGLVMAITTGVLINTKYKDTLVKWLLRICYVTVAVVITTIIHTILRTCLTGGK